VRWLISRHQTIESALRAVASAGGAWIPPRATVLQLALWCGVPRQNQSIEKLIHTQKHKNNLTQYFG
jgi:hypothetical protein